MIGYGLVTRTPYELPNRPGILKYVRGSEGPQVTFNAINHIERDDSKSSLPQLLIPCITCRSFFLAAGPLHSTTMSGQSRSLNVTQIILKITCLFKTPLSVGLHT